MPKNRYFFNQNLKENEIIKISGPEASHMQIVMRKKEKEAVEIINGRGSLAEAQIKKISENTIELEIKNIFFEKEKKQKLILIQAIIKSDKIELILEKCTELGCDEFWFFYSKNSQKINFSKNKLDRFQNILIAATKQCGRLYLPKIKFINELTDLTNLKGHIYFGSLEKDSASLIEPNKKNDENIFFIIGPESGFSNEESSYLKEKKAKGIRLNKNILRSETAAISAISIISNLQL